MTCPEGYTAQAIEVHQRNPEGHPVIWVCVQG